MLKFRNKCLYYKSISGKWVFIIKPLVFAEQAKYEFYYELVKYAAADKEIELKEREEAMIMSVALHGLEQNILAIEAINLIRSR